MMKVSPHLKPSDKSGQNSIPVGEEDDFSQNPPEEKRRETEWSSFTPERPQKGDKDFGD
jgi:hypothetical protein